jgi:hypothetical protein
MKWEGREREAVEEAGSTIRWGQAQKAKKSETR